MTKDEPDRATRELSAGGKRLVLVVHGLGDNTPGAAVGPFARAVATASGRSRVPREEVSWLSEGSGRQVKDFPCHVERLRYGGTETVLAEVYWADLSRLGRGILDLLLGVFRVLFGLHQLTARHAADPTRLQGSTREPAAWALQKLSLVSAYLLRGPAAAAFLLWAFGLVISAVALKVGGPAVSDHQRGWVAGISVAVHLIGFAIGTWGFRRWRGRLHRTLFLWLASFGAMNLLFWLMSFEYTLAEMLPLTTEDSALGVAWASTFKMVELPQVIVFHLIALATLAWLVARVRAAPALRPGLDAVQGVNLAVLGLWVLLAWSLVLLLTQKLPEEAIPPEVGVLVGGLATGITFYGIFALISVGALLATLGLQKRWAKKTDAGSYRASRPAPRLILGGGILVSLISAPILLLLLPLAPGFRSWLFESLNGTNRIVIPAVTLVAGVAVYASERLHFALDFGLDFVSHFEAQRSEPDGKLAYVRRERIRDRLRIVLKTLIREEEPDRVTVLAHSQGTVVASETLAEVGAGALIDPLTGCDLVTMGSPFHHIYQHYFPNDYPPLGDERWNGLRQRVDRWYNIFRIDDPVGTDIEPGGVWPANCPVDAGGHTNYWTDRQVLQILLDRQLV